MSTYEHPRIFLRQMETFVYLHCMCTPSEQKTGHKILFVINDFTILKYLSTQVTHYMAIENSGGGIFLSPKAAKW